LRHDDNTLTRTPDLVRWGPVAAGVIIGLAFCALLSSLWFALADSVGWVSGTLAWFVGVTAAVSLLIAGWVAGALAGVRGMLAGLVNGITAWGLLFILAVTVVLPGAALRGAGQPQGADVLGPAGSGFTAASAMWTSFWALLVGLALAAAGGILGGRMHRPVAIGDERAPARQPAAMQEGIAESTGRIETINERGDVRGRSRHQPEYAKEGAAEYAKKEKAEQVGEEKPVPTRSRRGR
jgi:hypothetical protein